MHYLKLFGGNANSNICALIEQIWNWIENKTYLVYHNQKSIIKIKEWLVVDKSTGVYKNIKDSKFVLWELQILKL